MHEIIAMNAELAANPGARTGLLLPNHYETSGFVEAVASLVFAHLDDHKRLASHMSKPTWKMGGGMMKFEMDSDAGKRIGSHIKLIGRVFGVQLAVEEVVTEREPPHRKTWETVGVPKLLVIANYRLGFEVTPKSTGSALRVFIDYELPKNGIARGLGLLFGRYYAKWCTHTMLNDAVAHFAISR